MSTVEADQTKTDIAGNPLTPPEEIPVAGEVLDGDDDAVRVVDEQLDDLEIQVATREWKIEGDVTVINPRTSQNETFEFSRVYYQKPLSYTAMLQFTGLLGSNIQKVMAQGVTLNSILGDASTMMSLFNTEEGGAFDSGDFNAIDSFVNGLAKLASYLPDIVEECQCIWLRVPLAERYVVKEIWSRSPEDGGLSMQEGEEMLNLFIAQNYPELEDFFVERLPRVAKASGVIRKRMMKGRSASALLP
jgi:hypothetical protein